MKRVYVSASASWVIYYSAVGIVIDHCTNDDGKIIYEYRLDKVSMKIVCVVPETVAADIIKELDYYAAGAWVKLSDLT